MARKNKDAKPEITESVLEKVVTITMLNERYWDFEKRGNPTFYELAFESYFRYLKDLKPALTPYKSYDAVKNELDKTEARFKRQVSKIYVNTTGYMSRVCKAIAEEYRRPNSINGLRSIYDMDDFTIKRDGSKYIVHQSFDEQEELLGGKYELVTELNKPLSRIAAKGNILLDCEWVKIE